MVTFQNVVITNRPMVRCRMMLGEVIGIVVHPFVPEDSYKALQFLVAQPMELHVPRFRFLLAKGFVHKGTGGTIVGF